MEHQHHIQKHIHDLEYLLFVDEYGKPWRQLLSNPTRAHLWVPDLLDLLKRLEEETKSEQPKETTAVCETDDTDCDWHTVVVVFPFWQTMRALRQRIDTDYRLCTALRLHKICPETGHVVHNIQEWLNHEWKWIKSPLGIQQLIHAILLNTTKGKSEDAKLIPGVSKSTAIVRYGKEMAWTSLYSVSRSMLLTLLLRYRLHYCLPYSTYLSPCQFLWILEQLVRLARLAGSA